MIWGGDPNWISTPSRKDAEQNVDWKRRLQAKDIVQALQELDQAHRALTVVPSSTSSQASASDTSVKLIPNLVLRGVAEDLDWVNALVQDYGDRLREAKGRAEQPDKMLASDCILDTLEGSPELMLRLEKRQLTKDRRGESRHHFAHEAHPSNVFIVIQERTESDVDSWFRTNADMTEIVNSMLQPIFPTASECIMYETQVSVQVEGVSEANVRATIPDGFLIGNKKAFQRRKHKMSSVMFQHAKSLQALNLTILSDIREAKISPACAMLHQVRSRIRNY
jgi:hypothetical protein